jgi:hypothetical protein
MILLAGTCALYDATTINLDLTYRMPALVIFTEAISPGLTIFCRSYSS